MTIERIVGENIEKYFKISGMTLTNFGKQIDTPNTTYIRKMFSGDVSIGTQDAWKDVKENEAEIQRLRLILWGREEKVKDVTARQKQIIHQLVQNDRLSNAEVGRIVGCTREYVASIRRELKRGAYDGYTSGLYQVEVNILKLHSEGLDVREIANKLNISTDDAKNALEELEGLL